MINKEAEQRWDKTLLKGFAQGALGGYLIFESKRLVREFSEHRNYNLIWPSKLVNAAGSSIIENAAANRDFGERWHLNLGFNRIEILTKEGFKLRYRILPLSLLSTAAHFTKGKLDVDRSLVFGTFVFTANGPIMSGGEEAGASALFHSILLQQKLPDAHRIEGHEILHVYQYEGLSGINMFLNKPLENLKEDYRLIRWYDRIFHSDFNGAFMAGMYQLEMEAFGYRNISFEREARYFSFSN